jgi:ABC-type glycerol-3-phosphate transport system substrate-binding protein
MKLRNILALLLTLAMVFSLAACSAAGAGEATETAATEAPAATEETAATEATEAPSSEPVQLHAWAWLTNVDGLYEAAAEYEQLTGIKIELTVDTIAAADILTNLTTTNESETSALCRISSSCRIPTPIRTLPTIPIFFMM